MGDEISKETYLSSPTRLMTCEKTAYREMTGPKISVNSWNSVLFLDRSNSLLRSPTIHTIVSITSSYSFTVEWLCQKYPHNFESLEGSKEGLIVTWNRRDVKIMIELWFGIGLVSGYPVPSETQVLKALEDHLSKVWAPLGVRSDQVMWKRKCMVKRKIYCVYTLLLTQNWNISRLALMSWMRQLLCLFCATENLSIIRYILHAVGFLMWSCSSQ